MPVPRRKETVWPDFQPTVCKPIVTRGRFCFLPNQAISLGLPDGWSGRVWGRQGISFDPATGRDRCATGDCGGSLYCNGQGGTPPATLAEIIAFQAPNQQDFYGQDSLIKRAELHLEVNRRRQVDLAVADLVELEGQLRPPCLPMVCTPTGHIMFNGIMRYNPKNPYWFNRDRFVLPAGHGCMIHYALLHLTGYDNIKLGLISEAKGASNAMLHQEEQEQLYILSLSQLDPKPSMRRVRR